MDILNLYKFEIKNSIKILFNCKKNNDQKLEFLKATRLIGLSFR